MFTLNVCLNDKKETYVCRLGSEVSDSRSLELLKAQVNNMFRQLLDQGVLIRSMYALIEES